MDAKPPYSSTGFVLTTGRAMLFFSTLLMALVVLGLLVAGGGQSFGLSGPMALFIAAGLYLALGASWGLAYTKYADYPDRRDLLIVGALVSPAIMVVAILIIGAYWPPEFLQGEEAVPLFAIVLQLAIIYVALALSSGLQIFGIAIALRFFFKIKVPF